MGQFNVRFEAWCGARAPRQTQGCNARHCHLAGQGQALGRAPHTRPAGRSPRSQPSGCPQPRARPGPSPPQPRASPQRLEEGGGQVALAKAGDNNDLMRRVGWVEAGQRVGGTSRPASARAARRRARNTALAEPLPSRRRRHRPAPLLTSADTSWQAEAGTRGVRALTIVLPTFSGRLATSTAALTAAPASDCGQWWQQGAGISTAADDGTVSARSQASHPTTTPTDAHALLSLSTRIGQSAVSSGVAPSVHQSGLGPHPRGCPPFHPRRIQTRQPCAHGTGACARTRGDAHHHALLQRQAPRRVDGVVGGDLGAVGERRAGGWVGRSVRDDVG